jgi:hypothetical protein
MASSSKSQAYNKEKVIGDKEILELELHTNIIFMGSQIGKFQIIGSLIMMFVTKSSSSSSSSITMHIQPWVWMGNERYLHKNGPSRLDRLTS